LNFALVTRMMTDWLWPRGGVHRRLQTKHVRPVYPGDILTPKATVIQKTTSQETRWVLFEVELRKNQGEVVVQGDALAEFPN
jgi:3-hydroxybutyryl-CoA dehydratase